MHRLLIVGLGVAALLFAALLVLVLTTRSPSLSSAAPTFPTYDQIDEFAAALLDALGGPNDDRTLSLITGYEDIAEKIRNAALSDPSMLDRHDLTARHKLSILALRDRFSRADIAHMSPEALIQIHPDPSQSGLDLPEGAQIILNRVEQLGDREGLIALYIGDQFHEFALLQINGGWRIDLMEAFDPPSLTPIDVALMSRIAARGGQETAWLALYASLSGRSVDDGLLQIP